MAVAESRGRESPELSVCIATMNRADRLSETLESIVLQQDGSAIELVVIDSSTDDATARLVERFRARVAKLVYVKRSAAGVDAAYDESVRLASGAYCWLMTDDDVIAPGAITAILGYTREGVDLVVVNAAVYDSDLRDVLEPRRMHVETDRAYAPAEYEALFADVAAYVSFIGGVVIRRGFWLERFSPDYLGSEFAHVRVIFSGSLPNGARLVATPFIRIRYGAAHWTSRTFRVWMLQWPSVLWSVRGISDAARRKLSPREPWRQLRTLLIVRAKGGYGVEEYRQLTAARPSMPLLTRLRAWCAARTPGVLANALLVGYVQLVRSDAPQARTGLRDYRDSPFYYRHYLRHIWRARGGHKA